MARRMVSPSQIANVADKSAENATAALKAKSLTFDTGYGGNITDIEQNTTGVGAGTALRDWLRGHKYIIQYKSQGSSSITYAVLNYDQNSKANIPDDVEKGAGISGTIIWGFVVDHYEGSETYANIKYTDLTGGTWTMGFSGNPWDSGYGYWHVNTLAAKAS